MVVQWPVQAPRRRFSSRQRTSRYMGVGSSNRKNQWQARILVYGKVTHLGYYETEDDAARWAATHYDSSSDLPLPSPPCVSVCNRTSLVTGCNRRPDLEGLASYIAMTITVLELLACFAPGTHSG